MKYEYEVLYKYKYKLGFGSNELGEFVLSAATTQSERVRLCEHKLFCGQGM